MRNIIVRGQRVLDRTPRRCRVRGTGGRCWLLALSLLVLASCGRSLTPASSDTLTTRKEPDTKDNELDSDGLDGRFELDVSFLDTSAVLDSAGPDDLGHPEVNTLDAEATLPKMCSSGLPKPGEACSKAGEIRCTNLGATDQVLSGFCYRPNQLRCVAQANGNLEWVLQDCGGRMMDPGYNPDKCGNLWSCMEDYGGDRCRPMVIVSLVKSSAPKEMQGLRGVTFRPCYPGASPPLNEKPNKTHCTIQGVSKCTRLADAGAIAEKIKKAVGSCAQYLEPGRWFLPIKLCSIEAFSCPPKTCYTGMPGWPNCPSTSLGACLYDPTQGGQARCRLGCDDRPDKDAK